MSDPIRVGIVSSAVPACDQYRASGPAEELVKQGAIKLVELPENFGVRHTRREHGPDSPMGLRGIPEELDVVVFVRGVMPSRIVEVIPLLKRRGIAVVVDVDDDYEHLPPALHQLYKLNPTMNPLYNWRHVKAGCELADLVTVSTPQLVRYGGRQGGVVLRNRVPDRYLNVGEFVQHRRDGRTVGWGGTIFGHPGDLRVTGTGVADAVREVGGTFLNIGDGVEIRSQLGLHEDPEVSGIVPLDHYAIHLARLDVAIAPLQDTWYSCCKSALKMIESLALGSVVVASPVAEYSELFSKLAGWCDRNDCRTPALLPRDRSRDWKRALLYFLKRSEKARAEDMAAARLFVKETQLMSRHAEEWLAAWQTAIERRQKARV